MGQGVENSLGCRRSSSGRGYLSLGEPGVDVNRKGSHGDIPVREEIIGVVQEEEKLFLQERMQQPTVEHAPVPQIREETVEVVLAPTERVQQRTVDVPMPQVLEETVEVVKLATHERVQQWTAEQIGGCT